MPHPSRDEKRTSLINWYKDNWDTMLGNVVFNDNDDNDNINNDNDNINNDNDNINNDND